MMRHAVPQPATADKPAIGLTMFGVTTPCVQAVARALEADHDCLVFHATGTGGRAMEKLVDSGLIAGVIDVTTTEVADFLVGGMLACTEDRFGAIARTGIPYVGSVGACDMVNFGALDTVPERFRGRNLYVHNPQVTLMRTTAGGERRRSAAGSATRLDACPGPLRFLLPEGGVSVIDAPGKPFHDPDGRRGPVRGRSRRRCGRARTGAWSGCPTPINAPEFAAALVQAYREVAA